MRKYERRLRKKVRLQPKGSQSGLGKRTLPTLYSSWRHQYVQKENTRQALLRYQVTFYCHPNSLSQKILELRGAVRKNQSCTLILQRWKHRPRNAKQVTNFLRLPTFHHISTNYSKSNLTSYIRGRLFANVSSYFEKLIYLRGVSQLLVQHPHKLEYFQRVLITIKWTFFFRQPSLFLSFSVI